MTETRNTLDPPRALGAQAKSGMLRRLLRVDRVQAVFARHNERSASAFLDAVLGELRIRYELSAVELARIPEMGGCLLVANQPFGGIEQLILLRMLIERRPDVRLLSHVPVHAAAPLETYMIPEHVLPAVSGERSVSGLDQAIAHAIGGGAVVVFPAADVSTYRRVDHGVADGPWRSDVLRAVHAAGLPVVPVYVRGTNSTVFHLLAHLHPKLSSARLPAELLNKHGQTIHVRVGAPIAAADQDAFASLAQYGRYLRALTYALGTSLPVRRFFRTPERRPKRVAEIIAPVDSEILEGEISTLDEERLFDHGKFAVYCAEAARIPNLLTEMGRLREVTFRAAGEGTLAETDNDEYDLTYRHLFIWDTHERCIVGAYRLAYGWELMDQLGVRGFYIHSLFKLRRPIYPVLAASIELGRSFVTEAYQQKPWPLFLLWKGIQTVVAASPECRYLIGPVSISNSYSRFSRELIVRFITEHYLSPDLARHVKPRKRFRFTGGPADADTVVRNGASSIADLDKLIFSLESGRFRVPILLKKYLKQNARIIGFNLDPLFNDALDGLMILEMHDLPESMTRALSRDARNAED